MLAVNYLISMPPISSYLKKVYGTPNRRLNKHRSPPNAFSPLLGINPPAPYISGCDVERDFSGFQHDALRLQLELLRRALKLTTAAFLWASDRGQIQLLSIVSERDDILSGPFER
ncbi:hypothetical protein MNBD_DELTA03-20, partial [hydrothermal vent metagenome]